ncbi:MAG: PilZ domain-containing protein [bacterium]|nr:PilZ domain-containing protein [bacterium]
MGLTLQQGIIIFSPEILKGEKLQALIKDITPDYLTIYIPFNNLEIKANTALTVLFWDEKANYEFKSMSLTTKKITEQVLNIMRPSTITRSINRAYPRVVLNCTGEIYDPENINRNKCVILDISASGAMIATKADRKVTELVKLSFILPDGEIFEDVKGQIMWMKLSGEGEGHFNYGVQFQALSEIRKNKIIKFVNSELRKLKK